MAENNTQSRKWLLTINNPSEHGLNHAAICEILEKFKKLDYWCMCDEEGDECSTLHTHIFIFIEQAINKINENGLVCYIVPNKFFKIGAGEKLRNLIAKERMLVSLDDFGDAQLFEDKIFKN